MYVLFSVYIHRFTTTHVQYIPQKIHERQRLKTLPIITSHHPFPPTTFGPGKPGPQMSPSAINLMTISAMKITAKTWKIQKKTKIWRNEGEKIQNQHVKIEIEPQKFTWNLEMMVSNRNLLFQGSIFRLHVCFGGCRTQSQKLES